MEFPEAIKNLETLPSFEVVMKTVEVQKDTHIAELSDMKNAGNPQLLAYLAGSISALDIFMRNVDDVRERSN